MASRSRRYDVVLDSRKRVTLRGAQFTHYHVEEREDGSVILQPRVLVDPRISARSLSMMDEAMEHLAQGEASEPIDPSPVLRELETARRAPRKRRA